MNNNIFTPNFEEGKPDQVASFLRVAAGVFFVLTFGLLPIFFIPSVYTSLGFTKSIFVVGGMVLVLVLLSLYSLRLGLVRFHLPLSLGVFWLFVLTALVSAMLSGDTLDSLHGNVMETQTVMFLTLLGVIMTVGLFFGKYKSILSRLLFLIYSSATLLLWVHILRLFLGPEFLSFSLFVSPTHSYFGSFNDLAIFSGLLVIISIFLSYNVRNQAVKLLALLTIIPALVMMMVVNFHAIWIVVGLSSVLVLLYMLIKNTWFKQNQSELSNQKPKKVTVTVAVIVAILSSAFIFSGDFLGSKIANYTNVSHMEVRPAVGTTFDIVSSVYGDDAFLGVGPNRFEDAWRQHKNPVINQTEFWNVDFTAGSGFVPTVFATMGVVGGVFIIIFFLTFLYTGYRVLFSANIDEKYYLIAIVAYVSALYLWLMSIIYVPGTTLMILAALATGIAFSAYNKTIIKPNVDINIKRNQRHRAPLMIGVLLVIGLTTGFAYDVGKQYVAQVVYADTIVNSQTNYDFAKIDSRLARSQELFSQDVFPAERAKLRLTELNKLLDVAEPNSQQKEMFKAYVVEGIRLSKEAIDLDSTRPMNHALLLSFYNLINDSDSTEVATQKKQVLDKIATLDPTNPEYYILFAQLTARYGDFKSARDYLNKAISLKGNHTGALYLLSQLDIRDGNTESAIEVTKSIIQIEPMNPTRYFQLGLLLASIGKPEEAKGAFEQAIIYNPDYANARYFLALTYLDLNRRDDALTQLKLVQITNPENEELKQLIENVENDNFSKPETGFVTPVSDDESVGQEGDITTSFTEPQTDLVTPLNQGGVDGEVYQEESDEEAFEATTENNQSSTPAEVQE